MAKTSAKVPGEQRSAQPSVATVLDKNNNTVAETDYGYDGFALVSKPNIIQHDDSNYGTALTNRANLTSVTKKCTGCTNATSTTTYTWDTTGQPASMTDPCGNATCSDMTGSNHTTTYSFSDSWTGGSSPYPTNAYLTQITYPSTGATAHQLAFQYNYTFGDLMNSTDENDQVTSYVYNDTFDRLTETDYPDTGKTTVCANDNSLGACYSSTPAALSITTEQWITSSVQKTTVAIMDGMFHVVEKELTSDPSGTTYSPTAYDGMGRPRLVYNPTRCNPPTGTCAETTWGFTTTNYDALGRATTIIKQDGS